ncbi:unnamed protein product [Didymodactylos carnosus]|uniref:Uncharacterized protein n=1 Tax=Didymodactylos carnosus TaxID=1234261 RepID=A0A815HZM3_9BILA|nr:unnamed protein product [Didymodactylos carnosus]CAF4236087.1 unnamed protein product [Didymodactylos carnosus]
MSRGAMNRAGKMVLDRYDDFNRARTQLPSWGDEVDKKVQQFVEGTASGVIATAVWSFFETTRYFSRESQDGKGAKRVTLSPAKHNIE